MITAALEQASRGKAMKGNRRPYYRTIKGKPTKLKPKIVMKEIHGQVVPVKVYPAQWAKDGWDYNNPVEVLDRKR
jgi:hypothetical protein